jgi:hypothetical protein
MPNTPWHVGLEQAEKKAIVMDNMTDTAKEA